MDNGWRSAAKNLRRTWRRHETRLERDFLLFRFLYSGADITDNPDNSWEKEDWKDRAPDAI
jgi:hypothetical protein